MKKLFSVLMLLTSTVSYADICLYSAEPKATHWASGFIKALPEIPSNLKSRIDECEACVEQYRALPLETRITQILWTSGEPYAKQMTIENLDRYLVRIFVSNIDRMKSCTNIPGYDFKISADSR